MRIGRMFSNQTARHLLVLLVVTAAIGAYQISTTTLIAGDGATYIEYAGNLLSDPGKTIQAAEQPPGFPAIVLAARIISSQDMQPAPWTRQWILPSQVAVLLFRMGALVLLYFVGRQVVSARQAFLAVLILALLRKPAEYGSDVLSDWPHMFMLAGGMLLMIHGARRSCWWQFSLVGLVVGLGYLIRPECLQLVACGAIWLTARIVSPRGKMTRAKALCSAGTMVAACLLIALPYMIWKGSPLPKQFPALMEPASASLSEPGVVQGHLPAVMECSFAGDTARGLGELVNQLGNVLMWGFLPALVVGNLAFFRSRGRGSEGRAILGILILTNILVLSLWFADRDYISKRHVLPLVAYTIFHVPAGVKIIGQWIAWLSVKLKAKARWRTSPAFWTCVYLAAAIIPLVIELKTPIRGTKQAYVDAANWVRANSTPDDAIVTLERRIAFYAERPYRLGYRRHYYPLSRYVVQVADADEKLLYLSDSDLTLVQSWPLANGGQVVVYSISSYGK